MSEEQHQPKRMNYGVPSDSKLRLLYALEPKGATVDFDGNVTGPRAGKHDPRTVHSCLRRRWLRTHEWGTFGPPYVLAAIGRGELDWWRRRKKKKAQKVALPAIPQQASEGNEQG